MRNFVGTSVSRVGVVGAVKFEARINESHRELARLAALIEPLLVVRRVLREQIAILHRRLLTSGETMMFAGV